MAINKILLIDDSASALLWLRMILKSPDYVLFSTNDGAQAIDLAQRERPDLIVLDADMPNMGGLEVCRSLRTGAVTRKIPIVILHSRDDAKAIEMGRRAGATDYLVKPIQRDQLVAKARAILGVRDRTETSAPHARWTPTESKTPVGQTKVEA